MRPARVATPGRARRASEPVPRTTPRWPGLHPSERGRRIQLSEVGQLRGIDETAAGELKQPRHDCWPTGSNRGDRARTEKNVAAGRAWSDCARPTGCYTTLSTQDQQHVVMITGTR